MGFRLRRNPLTLVLAVRKAQCASTNSCSPIFPQFVSETSVLHQTGAVNFAEVQKFSKAALTSVTAP